jgi:colanic acid/amylovoran biosynthesis glycosyltransferase
MTRDTIACLKIGFLPLTENFIYEQFKNIKKFNVIVICAKKMNLDLFPMDNIRCLCDLNPLSYLYNGVQLKFRKYCPYFADIIKKEKVKLIHAPFGPDGLHAISYKKKFNTPLITDFRGYDIGRLPRKNPHMYNELFEVGDLFLVRSENMKKDLIQLGCPRDKIKVHHSSIDLGKFQFKPRAPPENGEIKLLLVGRLTEKKGIKYAIHAVEKLVERSWNISLNIIGDGPLKKQLEHTIRELNLTHRVKLLGSKPHSEVIKTMQNSHILILSSITAPDGDKEGIPNVLTEAMATGMPVVATEHGGIPELITDGINGLLVPEKNSDMLAEKIEYLLEHPQLWSEFAENGLKKVREEYDIVKQTKRLEDIYTKLIYR